MMFYDNYHFTTKVTTDGNADHELTGEERNIFFGGGCLVIFPAGHKWEGPWMVAKVNQRTCIIASQLDKNGKPVRTDDTSSIHHPSILPTQPRKAQAPTQQPCSHAVLLPLRTFTD